MRQPNFLQMEDDLNFFSGCGTTPGNLVLNQYCIIACFIPPTNSDTMNIIILQFLQFHVKNSFKIFQICNSYAQFGFCFFHMPNIRGIFWKLYGSRFSNVANIWLHKFTNKEFQTQYLNW
jgi:hypothetical protein